MCARRGSYRILNFGRGETPKVGVDEEGLYSNNNWGGGRGMLHLIFLIFFLIDALRLILGHSGDTSSQF